MPHFEFCYASAKLFVIYEVLIGSYNLCSFGNTLLSAYVKPIDLRSSWSRAVDVSIFLGCVRIQNESKKKSGYRSSNLWPNHPKNMAILVRFPKIRDQIRSFSPWVKSPFITQQRSDKGLYNCILKDVLQLWVGGHTFERLVLNFYLATDDYLRAILRGKWRIVSLLF